MATWIASPIVAGLSGELGGIVFHSGARSNVLARRPSRCRVTTPEQDRWQRAMIRVLGVWDAFTDEKRGAWNQYARTRTVTDRFGRKRHRSGQATFVEYVMRLDPFNRVIVWEDVPVPGDVTIPYVTVSVAFSVGGPYNVTVDVYPSKDDQDVMEISRFQQYGNRPGVGGKQRFGLFTRTGYTANVYSTFMAKNVNLVAGEHFRLEIWRWYFGKWPSTSVFVEGRVT